MIDGVLIALGTILLIVVFVVVVVTVQTMASDLFGPYNIRKLKAKRDVDGLIEALGYKKKVDVQYRAITALAEIGDPRAMEPFIALLTDTNQDLRVRAHAGFALPKLGWKPGKSEAGAAYWILQGEWDKCAAVGARAVKPLIERLGCGDARINVPAAQALAKVGEPAVEALIGVLGGGDRRTRELAAEALGNVGSKRAVDALVGALKGKAPDDELGFVRYRAATSLGKIGDPRAVDALIMALEGESPGVREAAATALGQIRDPRAIEPLIAALKSNELEDARGQIRASAATALGEICDGRAVQPLILALRTAHTSVRDSAARALGKIGDPRAVEVLIPWLQQGWATAAEVLGQIGGVEAVKALEAASDHHDLKVQQAAAAALRKTQQG
jgi:HEAT repeat protein